MEEFVVSNDELKQMFENKEMVDTGKGWFYKGIEIQIAAIHEQEPKYLLDKARSQNYRIMPKEK